MVIIKYTELNASNEEVRLLPILHHFLIIDAGEAADECRARNSQKTGSVSRALRLRSESQLSSTTIPDIQLYKYENR